MGKRIFQLLFSLPLFISTVQAQQNFPTQMAGEYTCEIRSGCVASFKMVIEVNPSNLNRFTLRDSCPNSYSGQFDLGMSSPTNVFSGSSTSCGSGSFFGEFFPATDSLYAQRYELGCGSGCTCGLIYKCKKNLPVGLQEEEGKKLKLLPNPVHRQLQIGGIQYPLFYEIFGMNGRTLLQGQLNSSSPNIRVEELPKGIYFIQLRQEDEVEVLKFVKQ